MHIEISVIIPCLNEEKNIDLLVQKLQKCFMSASLSGEMIFVDDKSTDNTAYVLKKVSSVHSNIKIVTHNINQGITESWASGLAMSEGKYVVTIDADLQYDPHDIVTLYKEIIKGDCDLVQGWRKVYKEKSMLRSVLSKGLSILLNILFCTNIPDIKSGFVIYKRNVFQSILRERSKFKLYQHFFILDAITKNYKLKQVPIAFNERQAGESFINDPFAFAMAVLGDLPRAFFDYNVFKRKKGVT